MFRTIRNFFVVQALFFALATGVGATTPASPTSTARTATPAEAIPGISPTLTAVATPSADNELLFGPGETLAATNTAPIIIDSPLETSLRIMTSLVFVILLVLAISWWFQRRSGLNRAAFGRTLGIMPLDNKHCLYLVEILGRVLVLGVTDQSINVLCEIDDPTTLDALKLDPKTANPVLSEHLGSMFGFLARAKARILGEEGTAVGIEQRTRATEEQVRRIQDLLIKREATNRDGTAADTARDGQSPRPPEGTR